MSKKALANAERVADEAIAKLAYLEDAVRGLLTMQGLGPRLEPNIWQDLDSARVSAARLRKELEG